MIYQQAFLSTVRLYADDIILYTTVDSIDDCHQLQKDLALLERWAKNWQMTFNAQKFEFIRITLTITHCMIQLCRRLNTPSI